MWVIKTNLAFEMAIVVDFDIKSLDFVWVAAPETKFSKFHNFQFRNDVIFLGEGDSDEA